MTKTCRKCGQEKPVSEFSPNSDGTKTYPRSACKVCEAANKRKVRRENGEHVRKVSRSYFASNGTAKTERAMRSKAWRDKKRAEGTLAGFYRKYNYGLTEEAFEALCKVYPVCGICGRDCELDTDHCHKTGKVRGRLCTNCNTAIGKLGDDIPGLMRAVEYLASPKF